MKLQDFDFHLPAEQIAQYPSPERDQSRLLVLNRSDGSIQHRRFREIVEFLAPEDVLVVNQTRVMPARLLGRRIGTGGRVEILLIRREGEEWLAMGRPGRRLRPGVLLEFDEGRLQGQITAREGEGRFTIRFSGTVEEIEKVGQIPLPPYIRRPPCEIDRNRYQTVFARETGAIAAPTAGLHFTPALLKRIQERGTAVVEVLLHVGPGTFEPVRTEDPRQHRLEPEFCRVDEESASRIRERRRKGGRIVAVGTTVVRTLETAAEQTGEVEAFRGWSGKFIYPPYRFKAVDALITNFHLPRSSLLLLVSAFAGRERLLSVYREAVEAGYRFYSYGDAMLIL